MLQYLDTSVPAVVPNHVRSARSRDPLSYTSLALAVVLTLLALALIPGLTAPASAADRGTIVNAGGNVNLRQGDTADAIFAFGADVTVAGTVKNSILAVGGDVRLGPTAVVGTELASNDTALILVGSSVTRDQGAEVTGETSNVSGSWAGDIWDSGVVDPIARPFQGNSLLGWLGSTIVYLLVALAIAALAPRQIARVRERSQHRFWSSLGWGALGTFIIVPAITILLIITIIGILALLPWGLVVFATYLFGAVAIAALIGGWLLPRLSYRQESLILASVVGVLILRVIGLIPFAGAIVVGVAWIVGFGAAFMAFWEWRRQKREVAREARLATAGEADRAA